VIEPYRWVYLDAAGGRLGGSERFPGREQAEAWMGEAWSDLRDRGVAEVELVEGSDDRPLYRMSLAEE
jgi:hypothetical protein